MSNDNTAIIKMNMDIDHHETEKTRMTTSIKAKLNQKLEHSRGGGVSVKLT